MNILSQLATKLKDFFIINGTPDVNPLTQWVAHKCTIRGEFISLSAAGKKAHQALVNSRYACISLLEKAHKFSLATSTLQELTDTRSQLLEVLDQKTHQQLTLRQKIFFMSRAKRVVAFSLGDYRHKSRWWQFIKSGIPRDVNTA